MEEGLLRMRGGTKVTRFPIHDTDSDTATQPIDYANAVLYLGGFQIVTATLASSLVSILGCSLVPTSLVSAVRTLTLTSIVAVALVYKPIRIGRVKGLDIVFSALRPCVYVYIASLVLEQLVHTCARDAAAPSWRRILVHFGSFVQLSAGFMRARNPTSEQDLPFLLVVATLILVAMLPPPAVILQGPLCSSPSLWTAGERLLRALCFSLLYCVFVFCSALPNRATRELLLCVCRAASASVWVLACHAYLLILVVPQGAIVVYYRVLEVDQGKAHGSDDDPEAGRRLLGATEDDQDETLEAREPKTVHSLHGEQTPKTPEERAQEAENERFAESLRREADLIRLSEKKTFENSGVGDAFARGVREVDNAPPATQHAQHTTENGMIRTNFGPFGPRSLVDISEASAQEGGGAHAGNFTKEQLEQIANTMT